MEVVARNNFNVFEFTVAKGQLKRVLAELDKNGLTQEELDECKQIAEKYKKPIRG